MSENDAVHVVWWSLVLGGFFGGAARVLIRGIHFPYLSRIGSQKQIVVVPGFVGDIIVGPLVAFVLLGSAAATFEFQSSFNAAGFWAPLVSSIVAGFGGAETLESLVGARLDKISAELLARAERILTT